MKTRIAVFALALASLAGAQSTQQPKYILGAGGGLDYYAGPTEKAMAWFGAASQMRENVYTWGTAIMKANGARLMGGIAPVVWEQPDVRFFIVPQIGAESTNGTYTLAMTVAAAGIVNVGRLFNRPEIGLLGLVGWNRTSDAPDPSAIRPVFALGITWQTTPAPSAKLHRTGGFLAKLWRR